MEPLMSKDIVTKEETMADCFWCLLPHKHFLLLLSFFLVLNGRVNKQPARTKCFWPKTQSKVLRENIWPLWFCNMFQNSKSSEEHFEKLPSLGMTVGSVTVSEISIGPFFPASP